MKIKFVSEDRTMHPQHEFDSLPRLGDFVSVVQSGGTTLQKVSRVNWVLFADGSPKEVEVHLSYEG